MGEINTRLAIENLIANLSAEYYNYVRQNIRLSNLKYAVALSKERLRIDEAHYTIGSKSRLDLLQAQSDFNADSSSLIRQYETVYTSNVNLNYLMAVDDVSEEINVSDSIIYPNAFLQEESLWESVLHSNSRLLLSNKNQSISELDFKNLQSRNYPYLRLNGGYGYSLNLYGSSSMKQQDNLGFNYGLTLGFTIFDGFNRQREQKNARIVIQNRKLQTEQLEHSLRADWVNMWMAYQNNLNLIALEEENLRASKEYYEAAIERYKLGTLAGIQLREAQNSLLGAEERLLQAKFNTKLCEISLLQISGQIGSYLE
jgi:outer membrane protein TolC